MKNISKLTLAAALLLSPALLSAQEAPEGAPSPGQIVDAAAPEEWVRIAPADLLVMDLEPDAAGNERRVIIQLMPAPFSQGWVNNIRKLARAKFWDGTSINRVQDNYVVQWGDASEEKALPEGLEMVPESGYELTYTKGLLKQLWQYGRYESDTAFAPVRSAELASGDAKFVDPYSRGVGFLNGFPIAVEKVPFKSKNHFPDSVWPVHCYGMVGVGRGYTPDTGTGAELYTVIGHAPRHLDRNIALVGRVIEGIEHMSSLPRGKGGLGFYEDESKRVPILSVRIVSELSEAEQPQFEYLSTEGATFAKYADARANRRDPFFNVPAGGADICNIPVPVRRVAAK